MTAAGRSLAARPPGVLLAALVAAVAWALSAVVLVRGGGYFVVLPRLGWVLPVAALATVTALASSRAGRPRVTTVTWFVVVAVFAFLWNVLVFWVRFGDATLYGLVPQARAAGVDFIDGLYDPARAFTTLNSGWPPFTLILGRPFTWFDPATARVIEIVVLAAAAAAAVVLSAVLAARAAPEPGVRGDASPAGDRGVRPLELGLFAGVWLATSAGFVYEMERGNIDLLALFFSLLAVWLLLRPRISPWWPALALAVAVNVKLYPGVLLVLVLWRYRWRAVVPVLVTNVALLLAAGPRVLMETVRGRAAVEGMDVVYWWGNHSAMSTARVFRELFALAPSWLYWPLLLVPLALWVGTLVLLFRRGWTERHAVVAAAACVPVMSTVPAISHDYKLVLFVFPLAVLVALVATRGGRGTIAWAGLFAVAAWVTVQLSRSALVMLPSLQNSKYLMIVLVQLLLLAVAWAEKTEAGAKAAERGSYDEGARPPARAAAEEETT